MTGEVRLKKKGCFISMLGPGAVLGTDVLHGIPYRHTYQCDSREVEVLTILAKDYLEVVLKKTSLLDEPPQDFDESQSQATTIDPRQAIRDAHNQIKARDNAIEFRAQQWKQVQHRSHPNRKIPISTCKPFIKTQSTSSVISHTDVSYPTESDLFPLSARALIKQPGKLSVLAEDVIAGESEPVILGLKRMKATAGKLMDSKASLATVATTATNNTTTTWSSGGHQTISRDASMNSLRNSSTTGNVWKGNIWSRNISKQLSSSVQKMHVARQDDVSIMPTPGTIPAAGRTVLMLCKQAPKGGKSDCDNITHNIAQRIAKYSVWGASRTRGAG